MARESMSQAPVPLLSPPARSGPALVLLILGEAPRASHLGLGWASASWLPRLTWSWVAASSELSEQAVGVQGAGLGGAPPPSNRAAKHTLFSLSFKTRVVNPLGHTESRPPPKPSCSPLLPAHLSVAPQAVSLPHQLDTSLSLPDYVPFPT